MTVSVYIFTISISDVTQLDAYLFSNISSDFKYLNYIPSSTSLTVAVTSSHTQSDIQTLLDAYPNPSGTQGTGIQTSEQVYTDVIRSYSNGNVTFGNNISLQNTYTIVNVPTPTVGSQVATKTYVDAISAGTALSKTSGPTFNVLVDNSSIEVNGSNQLRISSNSLGTGLSGGSGTSISVNASQTQITSVGSLTSLIVVGSLTAQSGLSANSNNITNVASPLTGTDAVNRNYVNSLVTNSAGIALSANLQILNVNVDGSSITVNGNNELQISTGALGTGLSGGNGTAISVNSSQTQITSVGTLTSLTVSGVTLVTNTTESNSLITGALRVAGGVAITKKLQVGGYLYALSGLSANSNVISSVSTPLADTDASNKKYVDDNITIAGNALSSSSVTLNVNVDGNSIEINGSNQLRISSGALGTGLSGGSGTVISVNASQTQITSVGTLTSLNVSGNLTVTSTEDSSDYTTGALQVAGGLNVKKNVMMGSVLNLTNTTDATTVNSGVLLVSGGASFAKKVQMSGTLNMNSNYIINLNLPVNNGDASSKLYVDNQTSLAGNGLTKTVNTFSVNVDSNSIEIFNNILRVASGIAGTGLSGGSGTTLSVNASQTQITSVGTLTSLSVTGSTSLGSNLNMNSNRIVSLSTPLVTTDAATKGYTDSLVVTAGTGLTKTGTVISINSNQPTVVSLGTLNLLEIGSNLSGTPDNTTGSFFTVNGSTFTDNVTNSNSTAPDIAFTTFDIPTLSAVNTNVTTVNAATVYISGSPVTGTNETIENSYSLLVGSGKVLIDGDLTVTGNVNNSSRTAYLREEETIGTNAGTFTQGIWTTRVLNQSTLDTGCGVNLSSNQITLLPGEYIFEASCPAYNVGIHVIRVYNVTNSSVEINGTSASTAQYIETRSFVKCKLTPVVTTVYEIQQKCQFTGLYDGLGVATGFNDIEIYSTVFISKLS
jgi:hypothetical protein